MGLAKIRKIVTAQVVNGITIHLRAIMGIVVRSIQVHLLHLVRLRRQHTALVVNGTIIPQQVTVDYPVVRRTLVHLLQRALM